MSSPCSEVAAGRWVSATIDRARLRLGGGVDGCGLLHQYAFGGVASPGRTTERRYCGDVRGRRVGPGGRRTPGPRHRWRPTVLVLGLLVSIVLAGAGVLWADTPGVGDAAQRVRALDAAHHVPDRDRPVPARFAAALVAAEDARFYSDPGIDPIGLIHAGWRVVAEHGQDPGGSTLDQQLAKQLYFGGRSGGPATIAREATVAVKLDAAYPKQRILDMYAAVTYFGHGYYGLHAARLGYFGHAAGPLTWGQASLLAGLVQAPSAYDPYTHPAAATARQHYVLARLAATGRLSPRQAHAIAAAAVPLARHART